MAESEVDFGNLFKKKLDRSQAEDNKHENREPPPLAALNYDPRDWYYDMSGDKIMVIFNHNTYKRTRYFRDKKPTSRTGTLRDVRVLTETFSKLGFQVTPHHDKTHDQILTILGELCAQPHTNTSCMCVCVLTHGENGGELFAHDRPYEMSDLLNKLQYNAPGLVGKPKLVIVQACRGGMVDAGQVVQLDGCGDPARLPSHVDTLVLTSSVEDYVSWRDYYGSWLIQELCRVVNATYRHLDVVQMAALVTSLVARERESNTPSDPTTHRMKQTPELRSTLTKLLRFDAGSDL